MKIGAHVSISGGLENAVNRALDIEADCIQIFSSAPVRWASADYAVQATDAFTRAVKANNLTPVFIHAPYLVNLATNNPATLKRSILALRNDLAFGDAIRSAGVILHIGSHKGSGKKAGIQQVITALGRILDEDYQTPLILENSAGEQNKIGNSFEDLAYILASINHPRVAYCLDTAHLYSAGHHLSDSSQVDRTINQTGEIIGLEKLVVMHANDTLTALGGGRDKHENIGQGNIGSAGFRALLNHPKLRDLPFIIETPGFDRQGPDRKNIRRLRQAVPETTI